MEGEERDWERKREREFGAKRFETPDNGAPPSRSRRLFFFTVSHASPMYTLYVRCDVPPLSQDTYQHPSHHDPVRV